jgi:hypothetical protein
MQKLNVVWEEGADVFLPPSVLADNQVTYHDSRRIDDIEQFPNASCILRITSMCLTDVTVSKDSICREE